MAEMDDELLIKFLLKETAPHEDALVRDWLAADTSNQAYLQQFETVWAISRNLASKSSIDENEAWAKFKQRTSAASPKEAEIRPIAQAFPWLRIAAAVLFVIIGAWAFYTYLHVGYTTLSSDQQVRVETLPDGSEVTLNKNSVLSYQGKFAGNKRNVTLERGEVFFKVAHDKAKPFVIHAGEVDVTVVGTSFNIKHQKGSTEVIVETGTVQVSRGSEMLVLTAGDKALIKSNGKPLKEKSTDKLYDYYRSKEFVADNTPLWRMVEILNEAYSARISIADEKLKGLRLTATFKEQPLENILLVISQTFDIKLEKADGRFILRSK